MSKPIVYYSAYTKIAYEINERYYKGVHFAYCSPFFYREDQPFSSNPKQIYLELSETTKAIKGDKHGHKIRDIASGILKGAGLKLKANVITQEEYDEIEYMVTENLQLADFFPVLFVIPNTAEVEAHMKKVPIKEKAANLSIEYRTESLERHQFDVIDL